MHTQIITTPYGSLRALWSSAGLYACEFDRDRELERSVEHGEYQGHVDDQLMVQFEDAIETFFMTVQMDFDLTHLDWSGVSEFHRAILRLCFQIPAGETRTYGELAELAGRPRAARAVGTAMARNRWPILIPCHRVVGAGGKLAGYSGTGGIATKCSLLEFESQATCNV
ncbi:MAG: MGMT family protein [Pirellulaceae bacterium]